MNMSIQERKRVLDELDQTFLGCPVTHQNHDWSDEPIDPRNPNSRLVKVCIACKMDWETYLFKA